MKQKHEFGCRSNLKAIKDGRTEQLLRIDVPQLFQSVKDIHWRERAFKKREWEEVDSCQEHIFKQKIALACQLKGPKYQSINAW